MQWIKVQTYLQGNTEAAEFIIIECMPYMDMYQADSLDDTIEQFTALL